MATEKVDVEALRCLQEERDAALKALRSLTPQGSEYQTPEECVEYVRRQRESTKATLVRFKRERDEARADAERLRARLLKWCHTYGKELVPGDHADTFGEGMRAAKQRVRHILDDFPRPQPGAAETARPKVVCLCGSTRVARDNFAEEYARLTDEGAIVLSVGRLQPVHGWDAKKKAALDELHLRKIDLADEVLVLNVGGYIGESTRKEIEYARRTGKPVRYLEPKGAAETCDHDYQANFGMNDSMHRYCTKCGRAE